MASLVSLSEFDRIDRLKLEYAHFSNAHFTTKPIGHIDFIAEREKMYGLKRD